MNPRAKVLTDEFDKLRAVLDGFDQTAADEQRDLSDSERDDYSEAVTRMEQIESELGDIAKREERFAAVARVQTQAQPALVRSAIELPTFEEQVKVRALHALGQDDGAYETMQRALQHGTSADGLSTSTVEGTLVKFVDSNRYAVNASRALPMPTNRSKTFRRPRVTQTTQVAAQAAEGDVLASRTLTVTGDTVTKATYGGVVNLSEQEIDWNEPDMLAQVMVDLAEQYGVTTEAAHCAAIEAAATSTTDFDMSTADASDFSAAAIDAAVAVYNASKQLPNIIFSAVDSWGFIAGLVDSDGRPIFPVLNPQNAAGSNTGGATAFNGLNPYGLRVVVSPAFSAGTLIVAASSLVEFYEQRKGQAQIAAPSTLEVQLAYRGYAASKVFTQAVNSLEAA